MTTMTVQPRPPEGYQHTDAGLIPQDWKCSRIDRHASIRTGAKNTQDREDDGLYPFFVRSQEVERINSYSYDGEAVLTAGDGVGTGKVFHYINGRFDVHQRVYRIAEFSNELDGRFFFYQFSTRFYDRIMSMTAKSSVDSVRMEMIAGMQIPLPTLAEQRAIAQALSDVDGVIGALEKLIAKKRAIKQAAMQQLLTGKTRLPGFGAKWETKRLGEFSAIRNQKVLPVNVPSDMLCVELEHVGQNNGRLLACSTARESTSTKYRFLQGDVLFGRLRPYLRKYWLAARDGICTTEIWPLAVDPQQAFAGFVHAVVQTDRFIEAASISYGTHMPRADWRVMRNFEVSVPEIDEQTAIATILSDMDAEIAALERRRDKTKQIKQGMMQQLLTGRVRLVEPQTLVAQPEAAADKAKSRNRAFNDAVVISVLAKHFGSEEYPLGRMRYQKLSYLLHRHAEGQVEGYLKKAAGPYNPNTRYGGSEKIALENGYVRQHQSGEYHGFVAADNIAEAEAYFGKRYGSQCIRWLEQFRHNRNDNLELLATVDMATEELRAAGKSVDVAGVKEILRGSADWKPKLDRPVFSDGKIAKAIEMCRKLFQ